MKKIIAVFWLALVLFSTLAGQAPMVWHGPSESGRRFPDGYMEAADGVGLVLFFTGDLTGHYEPCG